MLKIGCYYSILKNNHLERFRKYLSPHIYNIITSNPNIRSNLEPYFNAIIDKQQSIKDEEILVVKSKMNMIYNAHNVQQQTLVKFSKQLSQMIINDQIKHQSDLDRILQWLRYNIKHDKNIQLSQIKQCIIKQKQTQLPQLQSQLNKQILQHEKKGQNPKQCISIICKHLRQKFLSCDSKTIFDKVKQKLNNNHQNKNELKISKKDNHIWDKIGSIRPRILDQQCNSAQITKQHLLITKSIPRFRFPPQPNGYLHIGHVKAMRINFQSAKRLNGTCYLRYDDTNPQAESHQFIVNIEKNIKWLGYNPDKITFASDYFQQMLHYAHTLIKNGHAYVCESSKQQLQLQRKQQKCSPFRNRPIQQSLKLFPNLQAGQTLRLKGDMNAANPNLRDPIIYRYKEKQHPKTGHKYKIYPIYDFAHCLGDSIQHIDYSLCSLEFEVRRQLYYRYLHLLGLYKPIVWQYSRLNIQSSVLSKRKIKALIDSGVINSWSDPRLLTINGMINRGYTPTMLNNFIDKINASRAGNQNIIKFNVLERQMKKQLFIKAKKTMGVLEPICVKIVNLPTTQKNIEIDIFTTSKESKRIIKLTSAIFIDRNQKIEQGQQFILKYAGIYELINKNHNEITFKYISETIAQANTKNMQKLHWLSQQQATNMEIICYDNLLTNNDTFNENSEKVYKQSLVHRHILQDGNRSDYWQFQRVGYFKMGQKSIIRCCPL